MESAKSKMMKERHLPYAGYELYRSVFKKELLLPTKLTLSINSGAAVLGCKILFSHFKLRSRKKGKLAPIHYDSKKLNIPIYY